MGYILSTIGFLILIGAFCSNADNSIHQIYVQLQYLTAFLLIGCGQIIITLNCKLTKLNQNLNNINSILENSLKQEDNEDSQV